MIPFQAALFDLDGTVLDSLGVWRRVDEGFFGARGIQTPPDYAHKVSGMSFMQTVAYTIRRFDLPDSPESVVSEWTRLALDEYAHRVNEVPGALAYLRALRRAGVRLAAATANRAELFMPALENLGMAELFEFILTTADVGHKNKADGALFRMAAERLGVRPGDCAVFEDTLQGILGARAAGMRAYAVNSVACRPHHCEIDALADGVIDDFRGMRRYHEIPDGPARCVIFTARCEGDPAAAFEPRPGDFVLCADGGWRIARELGVKIDLILGDFDSSDVPPDVPFQRFPVEKDDTDTLLCVKKALSLGFDDILIVGGFGGRLDHTLANLQTLHFAARRRARAVMTDGSAWAAVARNGALRAPRMPGKLGVFALDETCRGVCIRGTKYEAENITLKNSLPVGACNDFTEAFAEISVKEGAVAVVVSGE